MSPANLSPLDSRPNLWEKTTLSSRVCPFCSSLGHEQFIRPDNMTIKFCQECGTYFVSPAPSEFALSEFYQKYSRTQEGRKTLENNLEKKIRRAHPFSDFRICEFASIMNMKGKRVLDIGFGNGDTLFKLRQIGAVVEGIDPDIDNVNSVKTLLNLNVSSKTLDDLKDEKFDLILMNDLIEHLLNPLDLLKKSQQLLNEKGLISVYTPNASFAHLEESPILFRVDLEHLNYLTFQTCRYISESLNMKIIHLESLGFPFLEGIVRKDSENLKNYKSHLSELIRDTPIEIGYNFLRTIRTPKKGLTYLERQGSYALFFIIQK